MKINIHMDETSLFDAVRMMFFYNFTLMLAFIRFTGMEDISIVMVIAPIVIHTIFRGIGKGIEEAREAEHNEE